MSGKRIYVLISKYCPKASFCGGHLGDHLGGHLGFLTRSVVINHFELGIKEAKNPHAS